MSVRDQILADQAIRAEGDQHTENTVRNAARSAGCLSVTFASLPAARQRAIFGGVVFGRRQVRHDVRREGFHVRRVVAYGMDYNIQFWTYAEVAALLNRGETVVGKRD